MTQPRHTLGIDLGGTKILAAAIDPEGRIVARSKKKTKAELGPETVSERILRTAREAVELSGLTFEDIDGVGIGTPGPVDSTTGIISEAPNIGYHNFNLKNFLEENLRRPAFVFNDVNVGTWGEYIMGAGRGMASCLGVFVGTGIGGGIVINHQLYEGAGRFAGEIGHMIVDLSGPLCNCGRRGCVEALASRLAITRNIQTAIGKGAKSSLTTIKKKNQQIRSNELREAFEREDKVVSRAIQQSAWYLGVGLGSAANLLNPDCIILGGGVVNALGDGYMQAVQESYAIHAFPAIASTSPLVMAELGDDAAILGAALLARRSMAAAAPEALTSS